MSNLNTILNKLGKIEAIHETNLGKHEIELALVDNIKKEALDHAKSLDKFNQDFNTLQNQLRALSVGYGKLTDTYLAWFGSYNTAEDKAKELGISLPNDLIKLEKDAIKNSNIARDLGNKIYKFLQ